MAGIQAHSLSVTILDNTGANCRACKMYRMPSALELSNFIYRFINFQDAYMHMHKYVWSH